jgi:hypothetical protein
MTPETADAPLLRHSDPAWRRPLPAPIVEARRLVAPIAAGILAMPEAALTRPWGWIGGSEEETRYGVYRLSEVLERAEIEARRELARAGVEGGLTAAIIAPADAARWDLHGLLAPLTAVELDGDPGGGEWTIRQTLGHTINAQRAYGWATAWWQEQEFTVDDPALPRSTPEALYATLPDEAGPEQAGSFDEIRGRLDATLDLSAERLAGMPEGRLAYGGRWSGFAVSLGFRLGRWSSHIREHTIQVEKTMAMLGRVPTEPERLARLTLAAYGRAEAVVFGQPGSDAAAQIIRAAVVEARDTLADARRAAEA